jgi:hypothetical protein
VHALGSQAIGRGPYRGGYWDLEVENGKISFARSDFPFGENGFATEVWEPFLVFVETEYPGDADLMYTTDRSDQLSTPKSLRLWAQHVADYVASETGG